jgi:hypothetical protein
MFMRRCSIRDHGQSNGFEVSFKDSGASIRLSDHGLFALMALVKPQRFRLCAGSNTNEMECEESVLSSWILSLKKFVSRNLFKLTSSEELRIQRLVKLSTGEFLNYLAFLDGFFRRHRAKCRLTPFGISSAN